MDIRFELDQPETLLVHGAQPSDRMRRLDGKTGSGETPEAATAALIDALRTAWYGDPETRAIRERRQGALDVRTNWIHHRGAWQVLLSGTEIGTAREYVPPRDDTFDIAALVGGTDTRVLAKAGA